MTLGSKVRFRERSQFSLSFSGDFEIVVGPCKLYPRLPPVVVIRGITGVWPTSELEMVDDKEGGRDAV